MKYSFILEIDDISKDDINELVNIFSDNKIKFHVLKSDKELKETQKYKEVINELRNYLKARIEVCVNRLSTPFCNFEKTTKERLILSQCLEKLEELEVEHE